MLEGELKKLIRQVTAKRQWNARKINWKTKWIKKRKINAIEESITQSPSVTKWQRLVTVTINQHREKVGGSLTLI